jgi:hypothetical protein
MLSDLTGMLARLRAVLPARWLPDTSPIADALLTGVAEGWARVGALFNYVRQQTRVLTATDVWLDIAARDYFGRRVGRRAAEGDDAYRQRIVHELRRIRGTRSAIVSALTDLTGRAPIVFEPARSTDTGGYGGGGVGYGVAGGWGSLSLPYQCFVTAFRPRGTGIAGVAGWGSSAAGWGRGSLEYASLEMIAGEVTDADIFAAVADVLPVATTAWTQISN